MVYATTLGFVAQFDRDPITGQPVVTVPATAPTPPDSDPAWQLVCMATHREEIYWSWQKSS